MKTKYFIADILFTKQYLNTYGNYNLDCDLFVLPNDKDINNIFKLYNVLYFDYAFDLISSYKTKINYTGSFILSKNFNEKSQFEFLDKFPKLSKIICENYKLFEFLSKKYKNSSLKIEYKPEEINYV